MKLLDLRLLYLFKKEKKFIEELYKQLKNSWDINEESKNILDKHTLYFKPYSEEHFNILYDLVKNKISEMTPEEKTIYLEYRKKHFDVLGDNRGFEFILSFFFGSSFTGIVKYFSDDKINNILFMAVFIILIFIYFEILISPKIIFNRKLISAIEKNIENEKNIINHKKLK